MRTRALAAAVVLAGLAATLALRAQPAPQPPVAQLCPGATAGAPQGFTVRFNDTSYRTAPTGEAGGTFRTGQDADLVLSAFDFDDAGGGLQFNHQSGIATDGVGLLVADTFNNRVLIWRKAPVANTEPDVVLGQPDFRHNSAGTGRHQLNWPTQISFGGGRLAVADTFNERILVWTGLPDENSAPADLVINGQSLGRDRGFAWPWGVWTDGERLAVSGTFSSSVLIWNRFPARDDAPADIVLKGGGAIGTPRTITSDGRRLVVGDHNARVPDRRPSGSFVWTRFPDSDGAPFDFFMEDPLDANAAWLKGTILDNERLVALGSTLFVWNRFPERRDAPYDVALRNFNFQAGDYGGVVVVDGRTYVSSGNANRILVYRGLPAAPDAAPEFTLGSPDACTNTLDSHDIITNAVPVVAGGGLFVSSDFDRRLYVWRHLPDQSGARPDVVMGLPFAPWDAGTDGRRLVLGGGSTLAIWDELPFDGQAPSRMLQNRVGSVQLTDVKGVAIDGKYFYVADAAAGRVYVWAGLPAQNSSPLFSLSVEQPQRIESDGEYLTVASHADHRVRVYRVSGIGPSTVPGLVGGVGVFNLPAQAFTWRGQLFVSDTSNARVVVWTSVQRAMTGAPADAVIGREHAGDRRAAIARNGLFWTGASFFDGRYLWVGEFKFGNRLLRFSPTP